MSKLIIKHGVRRITRTKLQTYIDQTVADDIALMAECTNNELPYIVNELLRFALTQDEDFQKYKAEQVTKPPTKNASTKPTLPQAKPSSEASTDQATPPVIPTRPH